MRLTGDRFTAEAAAFGSDLATLPDFPAEIRAPHGTLAGVSGFRLHVADHGILTPGDRPDVLVAMNPAALEADVGDLVASGVLVVDTDELTPRDLAEVGYATSPLEDGSRSGPTVHEVAMTSLTTAALEPLGIGEKDAEGSTNMFALGVLAPAPRSSAGR